MKYLVLILLAGCARGDLLIMAQEKRDCTRLKTELDRIQAKVLTDRIMTIKRQCEQQGFWE